MMISFAGFDAESKIFLLPLSLIIVPRLFFFGLGERFLKESENLDIAGRFDVDILGFGCDSSWSEASDKLKSGLSSGGGTSGQFSGDACKTTPVIMTLDDMISLFVIEDVMSDEHAIYYFMGYGMS